MYWLDYNNRSGMYFIDEYEDIDDLKEFVRNSVKSFLLNEVYEFRQTKFSFAIADDEGFLLEYRWGIND